MRARRPETFNVDGLFPFCYASFMNKESGFNPEEYVVPTQTESAPYKLILDADGNPPEGFISTYENDPLGLFTDTSSPLQLRATEALHTLFPMEDVVPYEERDLEKVFGVELSTEDKIQLARGLAYLRNEGRERLSNEIEKGPEYSRYVELVNDFLNAEFQVLNLQKRSSLETEQFHLVPFELPEDENNRVLGYSITLKESIHLDGPFLMGKGKLQIIEIMIHEAIHANAFERVRMKDGKHLSARSGYEINYPIEKGFLKSLNEAVVEKMTRAILFRNRAALDAEFGFTDKDWDELLPCYEAEVRMLDRLLNILKVRQGKSVEEVWAKFKRGEFTGEMIHLKEVLKVLESKEMDSLDDIF